VKSFVCNLCSLNFLYSEESDLWEGYELPIVTTFCLYLLEGLCKVLWIPSLYNNSLFNLKFKSNLNIP
jgi:hypothetical protein